MVIVLGLYYYAVISTGSSSLIFFHWIVTAILLLASGHGRLSIKKIAKYVEVKYAAFAGIACWAWGSWSTFHGIPHNLRDIFLAIAKWRYIDALTTDDSENTHGREDRSDKEKLSLQTLVTDQVYSCCVTILINTALRLHSESTF